MAIKRLSEVRRLRRLGRIRLGEKKISANSGKAYPSALDHFNFKDAPELLAMFGENCKEIEVVIPVEDIEAFFPQKRKAYRLSGLFCAGDGDTEDNQGTAMRVNVGLSDGEKNSPKVPKGQALDPEGAGFIKDAKLNTKVGEMFELPCKGSDCPFTLQKFCKPIGRFLFIIPKAPRVGVWEISTTSFNSIVELNSSIDTVRGIAGRISMIPLKLKLVPKDTNVEGKKKTIHHLVLEYHGTFEALGQYRNLIPIPRAQLPTAAELDQDPPEDLVPHGGADLEEHVGGAAPVAAKPTPKPAPVEEPADEPPVDEDEPREAEVVEKPRVIPPAPLPPKPKPAAPAPVRKAPSRSLFQ